MKVQLTKNDYNSKDIDLIDGNKTLNIMFGGTGDLYWIIKNKDVKKGTEYTYDNFTITKENYSLYALFEQVFEDIKNINIFDKDITDFPPYIETDEEKKEYLEEKELEKLNYKKFNVSYYNNLYNEENNTITWVSDETGFEVGNVLKISKVDDEFLIEFCTQPYIEGYERESNYPGLMGIRFRNSGSRYTPFNIIFMRMYSKLQNINDVNDIGHQIHIEEYLYSKKKN